VDRQVDPSHERNRKISSSNS